MNELDLLGQLRAIDTPVEPSPRFSDQLFNKLTVERRRQVGRPSGTGYQRPQLLQMAAASMAILVVLGLGFVFLSSRPGPAVSPSASPSATPAPSIAPGPTHAPASILPTGSQAWRAFTEDTMVDVSEWSGGLVAAGQEDVWLSAVGSGWLRGAYPADLSTPLEVFDGPGGEIVVVGIETGPIGWSVVQSWSSVDGQTWSSPVEWTAPSPQDLRIEGSEAGNLMTDLLGDPTSIWQSADGLEWSAIDSGFIPDGEHVVGLAMAGLTRLVVSCPEPVAPFSSIECRTHTSDGQSAWSTSEPLPAEVHVAWFEGRWIAAGGSVDGDGVLFWESTDGLDWEPSVQIGRWSGAQNNSVYRLDVAGDQLLVTTGPSYSDSFVSEDGRTWKRVALYNGYIEEAAGVGGTIVGNYNGDLMTWDTVAAASPSSPVAPAESWQLGSEPPLPIASFIDSTDGLLWAFGFAEEPQPYTARVLDLMSYDSATDEWTDHGTLTGMEMGSTPEMYASVVVPEGDIFVFGAASNVTETPIAWRIDRETMTVIGQMPDASNTARAVVAPDGTVYVLHIVRDDLSDTSPARLWRFDPTTEQFTLLPPIPENRTGSLLVADVHGSAWVLGAGVVFVPNPDSPMSTPHDAAVKYDPSTNAWTEAPPVPRSNVEHAAADVATSGFDAALYVLSAPDLQMLRLPADADSWEMVESPDLPAAGGLIGMEGTSGGRLVVLEGNARVFVADISDVTAGN